MPQDFASLKRSSDSSLSKLTKELEKIGAPNTKASDEDRFWKPEVDKAGNGSATIRFLPAPSGEDLPFIRIWDHGFQGPTGKWYIENSLTTINQPDPVAEYNSQLWNISDDDNSPTRKQARDQKRRLHFISNILVVKDPAHPENEGKVFLYKYGKKIFDKIKDLMHPQFEDEEAIDPFNMWTGANFKLKIRKFEGYRNYDKSEFSPASAISDDDSELEKIWNKCYSLNTFLDPSNFKSYDDLKTKLNLVLDLNKDQPRQALPTASAPKIREKAVESLPESSTPPWSVEEDEDMSYFAKLKAIAEED